MNDVIPHDDTDPRTTANEVIELIAKMADELTALRERQEDTTQHLRLLSADVREAKISSAETRQMANPEGYAAVVRQYTGEAMAEHLKTVSRIAQASASAASELAAAQAAQRAIEKTRDTLTSTANDVFRKYHQSAGEARREAWRWFGGFWVWIASMLAVGALLGALVAFWLGGTISAYEFGQNPDWFCGSAGGEKGQTENGRKYCAFWWD